MFVSSALLSTASSNRRLFFSVLVNWVTNRKKSYKLDGKTFLIKAGGRDSLLLTFQIDAADLIKKLDTEEKRKKFGDYNKLAKHLFEKYLDSL